MKNKQTHLEFEELVKIGTTLNKLPEEDKDMIWEYINHLNGRVRSLESVINHVIYNLENT